MTDPTRTAAPPDASVSRGDADATITPPASGVGPPHADSDLVLDLAAEYEDARTNRRPVDVAVLCRGRPDLIPKVEALIGLGGMLAAAAVHAAKALPPDDDEPPFGTPPEPGPLVPIKATPMPPLPSARRRR